MARKWGINLRGERKLILGDQLRNHCLLSKCSKAIAVKMKGKGKEWISSEREKLNRLQWQTNVGIRKDVGERKDGIK